MKVKDRTLDSGQLFEDAQLQTGLQDFGDSQIPLRLAVLVASIEREAKLHRIGRFLVRKHLTSLLTRRLLLEQLWKRSKPVKGTIESPIFITGIPRSGSTFLHELLVAHESNRALRAWEMLEPLGSTVAFRKARTAIALWVFRRLASGADAVHPLRANSPHECVSLHSYSFLSREFGTMLKVPTYDAFLDQVDCTPAYLWQKRFLERAQSGGPVRRWILKAPDHAYSLDALFKVFPDAIVIQTHRNPVHVINSATRMTSVVRKAFSNDLDIEEIARGEAEALHDKICRIQNFRERRPDLESRFIDVKYHKLIADPVRVVRDIYYKLNIPFGSEAEQQVQQLASRSSRYSQRRLNGRLSKVNTEDFVDVNRFAGYSEQVGAS
jgi:hypothetical protein